MMEVSPERYAFTPTLDDIHRDIIRACQSLFESDQEKDKILRIVAKIIRILNGNSKPFKVSVLHQELNEVINDLRELPRVNGYTQENLALLLQILTSLEEEFSNWRSVAHPHDEDR